MADVRTGKLNQRIKIYSIERVKNSAGSMVSQRVLYWQTYAKIERIRGKKTLEAQQEVMKDAFKITVRFRKDKDVSKKLQVDYRGKVLNLTSIINDEESKLFVEFWGNYTEDNG